jgi:hypothetical protein
MRAVSGVIIVAVLLTSAASAALADDPVDLRGKQGVVDPATLKASDPKPPVVSAPPPPPPQVPQQPQSTTPIAGVRG